MNSAAAGRKSDPYNALIWNRDNQAARNGKVDRGDWFELWYYKAVVPGTDQAFYFYYAVVNPWDLAQTTAGSKSYLGFGSFGDGAHLEEDHPVSDFRARYDRTEVSIAENHATDRRLRGSLTDPRTGVRAQWDLKMESDWTFNAMGWTLPFANASNIFWYPAQASGAMSGTISYGDHTYVLDHAPAYQDRNWGRSMPQWWTWITANSFTGSPGSALVVGGGRPTLFGFVQGAEGLCIGLRHQGREYAFRTPDGDAITYDVRWGTWEIQAQNALGERIEISGYAPPEKFHVLPFYASGRGVMYDYEALKASVHVRLSRWQAWPPRWQPVAELETDESGLEWGTPNPLPR